MPNDPTRVTILDGLLREVGIPIDGISVVDANASPPEVVVQYRPEATAEQVALGDQIVAAFDWRKRRKLARNTVVAALQNLTAGERQAIQLHQLAQYLRDNPAVAEQVGTFLDVPIVVDEVDTDS